MDPVNLAGWLVCAVLIAAALLRYVTVVMNNAAIGVEPPFASALGRRARTPLLVFAIGVAALAIAGSIWWPFSGLWGPIVLVFAVAWQGNARWKVRSMEWVAPVAEGLSAGGTIVLFGGALGTLIAYVVAVAAEEKAVEPARVGISAFPFWEVMTTVATTTVAVLLAVWAVRADRVSAQKERRRLVLDEITKLMPELISAEASVYASDPRWEGAKLIAVTEPRGAEFFEFAFCGVDAARDLNLGAKGDPMMLPPYRMASIGVTQYIARAGALWVDDPEAFARRYQKDMTRLSQHGSVRNEIEFKYQKGINLDELYGGPERRSEWD